MRVIALEEIAKYFEKQNYSQTVSLNLKNNSLNVCVYTFEKFWIFTAGKTSPSSSAFGLFLGKYRQKYNKCILKPS